MCMIRSICIICSSFTSSIFVGVSHLQIKMLAYGRSVFILCLSRIELCRLQIDCQRKQFCYSCAKDHCKNFWHLRYSTICLFVISRLDHFLPSYKIQHTTTATFNKKLIGKNYYSPFKVSVDCGGGGCESFLSEHWILSCVMGISALSTMWVSVCAVVVSFG